MATVNSDSSDVRETQTSISQVSVQETKSLSQSQSDTHLCSDENECDVKMFAHGSFLCTADIPFLDINKICRLSVDGKIKEAIEEFRQEMSKEMRQLEERLVAENEKLISMTEERDGLREKLEKESKENADQVKKLEMNKLELEDTIGSLQDEIRTLKERIEITINQSKSFETQINELQQKSDEKKPEVQVQMKKNPFQSALYTAIESVVSQFSTAQQQDMQKMSDMKQEFKNGTENYKNGSHRPPVPAVAVHEVEDSAETNNI